MSATGRKSLLHPGDAVAALLVNDGGHYLLQKRDDRAEIFFPGFWGNFGGAMEHGESPEEALFRELYEELEVRFTHAEPFCRLILDFRYAGAGEVARHFFVVRVTREQTARIQVREGQGYGVFAGADIIGMARMVPYDSIAIWQHYARAEIGRRYEPPSKA